jgi:hypothetical protein
LGTSVRAWAKRIAVLAAPDIEPWHTGKSELLGAGATPTRASAAPADTRPTGSKLKLTPEAIGAERKVTTVRPAAQAQANCTRLAKDAFMIPLQMSGDGAQPSALPEANLPFMTLQWCGGDCFVDRSGLHLPCRSLPCAWWVDARGELLSSASGTIGVRRRRI